MFSFIFRSSQQRCSMRKDVLRNFAKFTGEHLCQRLFLNKVAGLRPAILIKKRLWHRCFPVNFAKFLRTPLFTEHLWWQLLDICSSSNKIQWSDTKYTIRAKTSDVRIKFIQGKIAFFKYSVPQKNKLNFFGSLKEFFIGGNTTNKQRTFHWTC